MKDTLVREVMIPIKNYVAVKQETNLVEVMRTLEDTRSSEKEHAHRDVIVFDDCGTFVGKVTMIDIFRALEPKYRRIEKAEGTDILSNTFIMNAVKEYNLWLEPMNGVCDRGSHLTVGEIMHVPEKTEFLQEHDTLEKALHLFVMGVHQPLIVKDGDKTTGVLRFGDLFEIVRARLLSCAAEN